MSLTVTLDIVQAFCLLDVFSCHLDVFSDRPPGNPRVLEGEDIQISSAVGARRKCGPKKSTDVVQL